MADAASIDSRRKSSRINTPSAVQPYGQTESRMTMGTDAVAELLIGGVNTVVMLIQPGPREHSIMEPPPYTLSHMNLAVTES
jgi:hypothetical protein